MTALHQRMFRTGALVAALAAAGMGASLASAQTAAPAPAAAATEAQPAAPAAQKAHKHRADRKDFAKRFARMQEFRAKRLAALKDKLNLTTQQQGAWDSYTTALKPPAAPKPEEFRARRAEFAKLTTPQRIDRMQARQAERAAHMAQRADATKAFYAQLTPEQQKTFDAQSLHAGKGPHGHRHHRSQDAQPAPAKG